MMENALENGISFANLTSKELQGYLSAVSDDFNPAADAMLGIQDYVNKLASLGRTIAVVANSLDGEMVMGILAGYFNNPSQGFSYISAFHVRISFRRMHIGRLLMDKAVEISREAGFHELRLKVNKDNDSGLSFYKRYGFVVINEDAKQFEMNYKL